MPQGQDFPVDRVERVECLLDAQQPLGACAAWVGEVCFPRSIDARAAELASGSASR